MFTIDSNQTIRISRGDDSGEFTLFVNKGTTINPIRHEFAYGTSIYSQPEQLVVTLDSSMWSTISESGFYSFTYLVESETKYSAWYNWEGEEIDLANYGITVVGTPLPTDAIVINHMVNKEEIYLSVYRINDVKEHFIFKKIFITNGDVVTLVDKGSSRKTSGNELITEDADIQLFIDGDDTKCIPAGEYRYIIVAKLYDIEKEKYYLNTITNEHKFYVLNTGYGIN